jgi:hypothetical protein
VTPCTSGTSDVANWHSRLSALEGLMAEVVVVVAKNNALAIIGEGMNQLEATKVSSMPNQTPCAIGYTLEHMSTPIVNLTKTRISRGHLMGFLTSMSLNFYSCLSSMFNSPCTFDYVPS